jgi:Fe-S cluster biogenesis protein NfuA
MQKQRDMHDRVEDALDKVRPALRADGGDARVVACDEENGSVSIQMLGAARDARSRNSTSSTPSKAL